jgi:hypothetical protein
MSPAETLCFDIFSPPPGDSDVISQVERLSSNETKIESWLGLFEQLHRFDKWSSCQG